MIINIWYRNEVGPELLHGGGLGVNCPLLLWVTLTLCTYIKYANFKSDLEHSYDCNAFERRKYCY
jgi:hypothetical protein